MKDTNIVKRETKLFDIEEVLSLFQEAAVTHGIKLGLGHDKMLSNDQFFALLRTKFVIEKNSDTTLVSSTTYPKTPGRFDFDREYVISANDEILIKGISKWIVVSFSERKLVRNPGVMYENCVEDSLFDSVDRIRFDYNNFKLVDNYQITNKDIDANNHVNNVSYANIIKKVYNIKDIKEFQIDYLQEVLNNETVEIYVYKDNEYTYVLGRCKNENCFIAKIKE